MPILEKINPGAKEVKAIILTPTRELTIQVAEELVSMRGKKKLKISPVYGGQSIVPQLRRLQNGVQIVVGTPGRIMDHLRRGTLDLAELKVVVLDEADIELPDVLTELQDRTQLTRRTIHRVLTGSGRLDDFLRNPQAFIELAGEAVKR